MLTIMHLGGSGGVRILHHPPSCYLEPLHASRLPFHNRRLLNCIDVKSGEGFLLLPLGLILQPATVLMKRTGKEYMICCEMYINTVYKILIFNGATLSVCIATITERIQLLVIKQGV